MRLFQSVGPNPRVATMFIAEKGLSIPRVFLDIQAGENRQPEYLAKNPHGGTPSLELDDGSYLSESIAICEYLDERHPGGDLIGASAEARAQTRSAMRYVDQQIVVPASNGFRSAEGLPMFKDRMLCVPDAAPGNKAYAQDGMRGVDRDLMGKEYLTGANFTLADILLFCFVEFGAMVGQAMPEDVANLKAWHARVASRPSAAISANPKHGA